MDLERDEAIELEIACEKDHAHAATTEPAFDAVRLVDEVALAERRCERGSGVDRGCGRDGREQRIDDLAAARGRQLRVRVRGVRVSGRRRVAWAAHRLSVATPASQRLRIPRGYPASK